MKTKAKINFTFCLSIINIVMLIGHAAISDTRSEPTPKKEYKDLIVRIDQNDKMTEELRKTVILLIQKGKILTKMIQNK